MGIMNLWNKIRKANAEDELMLSDRKVSALLKKIDDKGYTPTDEEIAALKRVESISFNSIPKSIDILTNLKQLRLWFSKNTIGLSGTENLTNLQCLDLSFSKNISLSGIENLTNLQWLNLSSTQIDSHELKRLSKLKNLTSLDLRHLKITKIPYQLLELNLPFDTTNKDPSCLERGIFLHGTVLTQQSLRLFKKDRSLIEKYYKSEIASVGGAEETNNS